MPQKPVKIHNNTCVAQMFNTVVMKPFDQSGTIVAHSDAVHCGPGQAVTINSPADATDNLICTASYWHWGMSMPARSDEWFSVGDTNPAPEYVLTAEIITKKDGPNGPVYTETNYYMRKRAF